MTAQNGVNTSLIRPDWIGRFQNRARHDCSKRGQHWQFLEEVQL